MENDVDISAEYKYICNITHDTFMNKKKEYIKKYKECHLTELLLDINMIIRQYLNVRKARIFKTREQYIYDTLIDLINYSIMVLICIQKN